MTLDDSFVPLLRDDLVRRDIDGEAVVWSPVRRVPVALGGAGTVMLDVVDGGATVRDLASDVSETIGIDAEVARSRVREVVSTFWGAGLLTTSEPQELHGSQPFITPTSSCMEASSCTGSVTSVNLDISGERLRVACTSRRASASLRRALEAHLVSERQPLGFLLKSSGVPKRHVLLDRGGFPLGYARRSRAAIAMLAMYLAGFVPLAAGHVRLRARALVRGEMAALCLWPLVYAPLPQEARLHAKGWRLLDRLTVDLDMTTGRVAVEVPSWELDWTASSTGHAARHELADEISIAAILVPTRPGDPLPSRASVVASLAGDSLSGDREAVLDCLQRLTARGRQIGVSAADPDDLLAKLHLVQGDWSGA